MCPAEFDVATVSTPIVDVIATVDDQFLANHNLSKGGRYLITEQEAIQDLIRSVQAGNMSSGGSAANTLAGLSNLGGAGCFVGKVGRDYLGQVFVEEMRKEGCDTSLEMGSLTSLSGCCLSLITEDADRTMCTYLGIGREVGPKDVPTDVIANSKILLLEGYLWDLPENRKAFLKSVKAAKKAGRQVAFSLSDSYWVKKNREAFLEIIEKYVDILFTNEEEISTLVGSDKVSEIIGFIAPRVDIVCLTRGIKGSIVIDHGKTYEIGLETVGTAVDTTGAGDQYAAGFLYGLTHNYSIEEAGKIAALCAGEVVSHHGPRPKVNLTELIAERFDFATVCEVTQQARRISL